MGGKRGGETATAELTGHLRFGPLVVDGLAGEGVDADLGHRQGGVLQLAVEPQHLSPLAGVLHHLEPRGAAGNERKNTRISAFTRLLEGSASSHEAVP